MKCKPLLIVVIIFITSSPSLIAQDWPQFLGPNRNSISPQKGLFRSWPEKGPEVLWSVDIGIGFGGPVVKNGKVYLLDRDDEVGDFMRCFSLKTGEELWRFSYHAPGKLPFPGSRSVPIVDDRHVYSCGPNGDLYCIDIHTHQPVWHKNVWKDFGGEKLPTWGITQNPIIYGDLLIVASQAPQAGVVAYHKVTGDIVWQTPSLGIVGYSNPKVVKIHGEDHIAMTTSSFRARGSDEVTMGKVVGLDPGTGKILWQYTNWDCGNSVPCPVEAGDNKLLIAGELRANMFRVDRTADGVFTVTELFTTEEFGDETKTPVLYNGHFYAMHRTVNKRDGLVCMDMEGNIKWQTKRNPNFDFGSMILADGLLLACDGFKTLYLIEPDPTAFKAVSKAEILREGGVSTEGFSGTVSSTQNYAPLALADGMLLIRDQYRMLCVRVGE